MRARVGRVLAASAIVLGAVSGCTAPGPAGPGAVPYLAGLHDVRPCPGITGFSCAMLSVRLDPFGPAPGRLSLQVTVSDVADAPRGVLVFLTGGPGEPGVPFVPWLTGRLGPALRGYRMVMFDQRGTGAGALNCPALQQQMGASDLTVPTPAAVRSCAAAIGPSRRYYATADTVADIEALRATLGVSRITLDGVSYGSYVAEQFALAHPAQVAGLRPGGGPVQVGPGRRGAHPARPAQHRQGEHLRRLGRSAPRAGRVGCRTGAARPERPRPGAPARRTRPQ